MDKKDVRVVEVFSKLQLAAEALIDVLAKDANGQERAVDGEELVSALKKGSSHASRFTEESAKAFAGEWTVVKQQASTSTGFSATLFQYKGPSDPVRGLTTGQYVLSFRSTEFIDDYARDNAATNTLEVKVGGFAYGQIADMEEWWKTLKASYPDMSSVSVTGYSLGGNLATNFAFLRKGEGAANPVARREYQHLADKYVKGASWELAGLKDDIKAEDIPRQILTPVVSICLGGGYAG